MNASLRFDLEVSSESVASWLIGRDGKLAPQLPRTAAVPLSYLVFLRTQPITGQSIHETLGRDPERGLYGGVRYRATRSLRVGDVLRASGSVVDRREVDTPRGRLTISTLSMAYSDESEIVAEESVRMIDLPAPSSAPSETSQPAPALSPVGLQPDLPGYDRMALVAPITRRQVSWMTVATGDINELHFDAEYARRRGYADIVVPAPLLSALIERELTEALASPVGELDLRYQAPTYPGETLDIRARQHGATVDLKVFIGQTCKIEGRARQGFGALG